MAKETLSGVNADILTLLEQTASIGWDNTRESSVYRILYLSSVLYSFKNPDKENLFAKIYHFDIDIKGPYSDEINKSLIFLDSNDYLIKSDNFFCINPENKIDLTDIKGQEEKIEWLKTIVYILGIYGEGKVYDFIIRDPQYQDNQERNAIKEINIDSKNKTVETLNSFKNAFEKSLGKDAQQISNREYLELYFEYVFSKVLKGDIEL